MKITSYTIFTLLIFFNSCAFVKSIEKQPTKQEVVQLKTVKTVKKLEVGATAVSATYAYSNEEPIKIGGAENNEGVFNELDFLNKLRDSNGEKVVYELIHSCCYYEIENPTHSKIGLLDCYKITAGEQEYFLYFAPFETAKNLLAPKGFTFAKVAA